MQITDLKPPSGSWHEHQQEANFKTHCVKNTSPEASAPCNEFGLPALKQGVVCKVPTHRKQWSKNSQRASTLKAAVTKTKKAQRAEQKSEDLVRGNVSDLTFGALKRHIECDCESENGIRKGILPPWL